MVRVLAELGRIISNATPSYCGEQCLQHTSEAAAQGLSTSEAEELVTRLAAARDVID